MTELCPVAIVLEQTNDPVAYVPPNWTNVLEEVYDLLSESDVSNSVPHHTPPVPFYCPHLYWDCVADSPNQSVAWPCKALINHGSHAVLVSEEFTASLGIQRQKLPCPEKVSMALNNSEKQEWILHDWIKLHLHDPTYSWTARTICAIIAPGLCTPVILGLPFLVHNTIVVDHATCTVIDKKSGFDLLHLTMSPIAPRSLLTLKATFAKLCTDRAVMIVELKLICNSHQQKHNLEAAPIRPCMTLAAIQQCIVCLADTELLATHSTMIKNEYPDLFDPIPHITELPSNVYCCIQLKDANKQIQTQSYQTPRRYKDAWLTLIKDHKAAG